MNYFIDFNQIGPFSSILQLPYGRLFVWEILEVGSHANESSVNSFNQLFVFAVVWGPRCCTVFKMGPCRRVTYRDVK